MDNLYVIYVNEKKKKERMAETEGSFGGVCGVFTTQDDP